MSIHVPEHMCIAVAFVVPEHHTTTLCLEHSRRATKQHSPPKLNQLNFILLVVHDKKQVEICMHCMYRGRSLNSSHLLISCRKSCQNIHSQTPRRVGKIHHFLILHCPATLGLPPD